MSDSEREASKQLIATAEARMRQAETFTWAVPGLALTGQALLLTIALDPSNSYRVKAVVGLAGLVILLPALHFLGKHTFNFDWLDAVTERERDRLGWPRMTRSHLLANIESFPEDTLLRQRDWWKDGHRARKNNWIYRPWMRVRNRLVVHVKAVTVWSVALGALAAFDAAVCVRSVWKLF